MSSSSSKRSAERQPRGSTSKRQKKQVQTKAQMEVLLKEKNERIIESEVLVGQLLEANDEAVAKNEELTLELEEQNNTLIMRSQMLLNYSRAIPTYKERAEEEKKRADHFRKKYLEMEKQRNELQQRRQEPTCPVCYDKFQYNAGERSPKILACGHTICECCLKQLWEMAGNPNRQQKRVECPVCRQVTGKVAKIEDLPKNYILTGAQ